MEVCGRICGERIGKPKLLSTSMTHKAFFSCIAIHCIEESIFQLKKTRANL